jgi:hypothetical protein
MVTVPASVLLLDVGIIQPDSEENATLAKSQKVFTFT